MRESDFDIPKYAQINRVALSRDMTRYGNMDECGIGTDWKVRGEARIGFFDTPNVAMRRQSVTVDYA